VRQFDQWRLERRHYHRRLGRRRPAAANAWLLALAGLLTVCAMLTPPSPVAAKEVETAGSLAQVASVPPPRRIPALLNPSFEDGFTVREASELEGAREWTLLFLQGDHPLCRAPCHRPEYKPVNRADHDQAQYVTDGQFSQRFFSTHARMFGTLTQRVEVEPRAWYEFSCDMKAKQDRPGGPAIFVGLNPWGGGVWDRQTVWGEETGVPDEWHRMTVRAQAWGGMATVIIASNPKWPTSHTVYVDNCTIREIPGPGEDCNCPGPGDCPECPECPVGGQGVDYGRIREIVGQEVRAARPIVTWPE